MIPMVPFSPFAQFGVYSSDVMSLINTLHDKLLAKRKSKWSLQELQLVITDYIKVLDKLQDANYLDCKQQLDYKLLRRLSTQSQTELAKLYICATTIVDMQHGLLASIKQLKIRALRRTMRVLTRELILAIVKYRAQVAPMMCATMLSEENS